MTENKNVFGILGHPLGHTLSPQIHTRLFEISGEQAEYKILDTPPEKLTDSFEYFKSLTGFNITIPYKIDIIKMCDTLDDTAKRYNSVNCI
ncbi:Shikimate 5-dehydrogenase, partial [human gut metagenome]